MRDRLFTPLGLNRTDDPARGGDPARRRGRPQRAWTAQPVPTPVWDLPRSVGPAGLIKSTVRDVLGFARLHLSGGLAPDGTRLLSEETVEAMAAAPRGPAGQVTSSATRGAWAGSASGGTGTGSSATTATPSARPGSCGSCPSRASRSRCSPTAATPATSTRTCTARSSPRSPGSRCRSPSLPPAEPVDVDVDAVRRHLRALLGPHGGAGRRPDAADDHPRPARRDGAGPGRGVHDGPRRSRPSSRSSRPEADTWAPVTFYELPGGERYVHFGVRATPRVD